MYRTINSPFKLAFTFIRFFGSCDKTLNHIIYFYDKAGKIKPKHERKAYKIHCVPMYWCIVLPLLFVLAGAGQCPPGYLLSNVANKCYRVYEDGLPFMQAQYTCTQGDGFLATIPNAAANDFVHSRFPIYHVY